MPRRRRSQAWRVVAASIVLHVTTLALVSNAQTSDDTCALRQSFSAGESSCSRACGGDAAACIAFDPTESGSVCPTNSSPACPLVVDGDCAYQCLQWPSDQAAGENWALVLSAETVNGSTNASQLQQSPQNVASIGVLELASRIKHVSIRGVPAATGAVVDVGVSLMLSGSGVTSLELAKLNMTDTSAPSISLNETVTLETLRITNSLLARFPVAVRSLATLQTLDLSSNDFVSFPQNQSIEALVNLDLSSNQLVSFEAVLPALKTLNLFENQLDAFPASIFYSTSLQSLNISGNRLQTARLVPAQYEFLKNLPSLSFDGFAESPKCDPSKEKTLKTFVVCVADGDQILTLSKATLTWYIMVPVGLATAMVVFGFWFCKRRRRRKRAEARAKRLQSTQLTSNGTTLNDAYDSDDSNVDDVDGGELTQQNSGSGGSRKLRTKQSSGASLWGDEELLACQVRYEDIEDVKQIGSGGFGVVWLVNYRQTRLLASKRLVKDQITRQKTRAFVAEIKLNTQLNHPSIVEFVGVAWTVETDLQALFEYMANGDLREYLDARRDAVVDSASRRRLSGWSQEKLQIAIDIVEALVYVHSFLPPLVHRDLKSRNVLLGVDMKAKLSDFGVSRFASEQHTMTAGVGTGKWLAPEVLSGDSDYDQLCDIYSFGVVLTELDTHALPYEELRLADVAILQMVATGSVRPQLRDDCPPEIQELTSRCLMTSRYARPSAMEIAYVLRTLLKNTDGIDNGDLCGAFL